jgi:ribokinase
LKVLNFGSLNIDSVYSVDHIVSGGETISSLAVEEFPGGKGLNQSIALARAGASVFHVGAVGSDGQLLIDTMSDAGVDLRFVEKVDARTGCAIIQLAKGGENAIVVYGGANQLLSASLVGRALETAAPGDMALLQNETSLTPFIIDEAYGRGLHIAFNPSPFDEGVLDCDLGKVSTFLINEVEGQQITGESAPEAILAVMHERFPEARVVLTLGAAGSRLQEGSTILSQAVYNVPVVDTTAAGDTFTGYFLAGLLRGGSSADALKVASRAAAIAIGTKGAAVSIPVREQVDAF